LGLVGASPRTRPKDTRQRKKAREKDLDHYNVSWSRGAMMWFRFLSRS